MSLKKRALVVEDTSFFKDMLRKFLFKFGYEVEVCMNGEEALSLAKSQDFDLIVADWLMPIKSGLDFIKEVRLFSNHRKTPIVMISSENDANKVKQVIGLGIIDSYLIKPITAETFEKQLERLKLI